MEAIDILTLLTDAPLTLLLVWLLIKEQRAHAETRAARDADNARAFERIAGLTERVVEAVERLDLPGQL